MNASREAFRCNTELNIISAVDCAVVHSSVPPTVQSFGSLHESSKFVRIIWSAIKELRCDAREIGILVETYAKSVARSVRNIRREIAL